MSNRNHKIKKSGKANTEPQLKRLAFATAIISLLDTILHIVEKIIDRLN